MQTPGQQREIPKFQNGYKNVNVARHCWISQVTRVILARVNTGLAMEDSQFPLPRLPGVDASRKVRSIPRRVRPSQGSQSTNELSKGRNSPKCSLLRECRRENRVIKDRPRVGMLMNQGERVEERDLGFPKTSTRGATPWRQRDNKMHCYPMSVVSVEGLGGTPPLGCGKQPLGLDVTENP
ncbi:hypothetical protein E5676_scaffold5G00020 [Cucumis melo var. makuwa]|uniref:Uncharacterized protein n=1 Tax=Cucumis melo var. makuwa TaxID=1194695 RepID=A0A5A7VJU5_CUCMM|nr:hypothetical protein E6C27_scaffold979G00430 [Cucumis melo var. makuwa]TYK14186.1 hypothetical protein E5676_scaffold5G00020 [Cucumis melo var. makuwa]